MIGYNHPLPTKLCNSFGHCSFKNKSTLLPLTLSTTTSNSTTTMNTLSTSANNSESSNYPTICARGNYVIVSEMRTTSLLTPQPHFGMMILARATLSLPTSSWQGKIGTCKANTTRTGFSTSCARAIRNGAKKHESASYASTRTHTYAHIRRTHPSHHCCSMQSATPGHLLTHKTSVTYTYPPPIPLTKRERWQPLSNATATRPNRDNWAQMSLQLMAREWAHRHGEGVCVCVCERERKGWRKRGHVCSNL